MRLNVTSFIVRAMSFFRIVIPKNHKWTDVVLHGMWITCSLFCSIVYSINTVNILDWEQLDSYQFSYITVDSFGVVISIVYFPLLTYFVKKNDYLLTEENLPKPVRVAQLSLIILLQFSAFVTLTLSIFSTASNYYVYVCMIATTASIFTISSATIVVLGVSTERFSKKVDQIETESLNNLEENLKNILYSFERLKLGAEPILFATFCFESIFFIFICYIMKKDQSVSPYIVYEILKLSYIAFAMEDCYHKYKSLIKTCRLYSFISK